MSGIIHGTSHKVLHLMKKPAPTLAVYWCYIARTNNDNVAWPSIQTLARDTGWGTTAVTNARQWLVEHQAIELVTDYIRPQWRNLEPQELARRRNLDKAHYYRPTGYIVVDGQRYDLLYVARDQEADKPNEPTEDDSTPAVTSDEVGDRKSREIAPDVAELDSTEKHLEIKDSAAPNGDHPGEVIPLPEKPRQRNPEFDALATVWFEVTLDTAEFAALGGRIGQHVAWLRGKQITVKRNGTKTVVPGCTHKVTADVLEKAKVEWYRQNPSAHHPTDVLKFIQHIDRFCRALADSPNGNGGLLPADPNCPNCGGMGAYTTNGVLVPVCECRKKGASNDSAAAA
jgi:hypothetical protein